MAKWLKINKNEFILIAGFILATLIYLKADGII